MIGVFNSGFDVPSPTNSQYSLIIDVNVVVVGQVISDAPIPFVRILYVDLLYFSAITSFSMVLRLVLPEAHLLYAERDT